MLRDLVLKNRTCRRFHEEEPVSEETLLKLIDLARTVPSTANSQALKFMLVTEPEEREMVFKSLLWAAALPDWNGPKEGERPAAYILVLCDQELAKSKPIDDGITAQTIMLGAAEEGLSGCIFGSIKREELYQNLSLEPGRYTIDLVLALGKGKEKVVITEVGEDGSTRYYRDEEQVHYVPKRKLADLIVKRGSKK